MQSMEHHPPADSATVWRRVRFPALVLLMMAVSLAVPIVASHPADAATTVTIAQFPVQGPCTFSDTFGDPRPGGPPHEGVDIIAQTGRKVYATDDGTLTVKYIDAPGQPSGNGWRLTRADSTYLFYGHLSAFATGLKVGSKVKAGQIIGAVGATGAAGIPHLHLEVHPKGGAAVDPTPIVQRVDGCATSKIPPQPTVVSTTTSTTSTSATSTTIVPPPPPAPLVDKWQFVTPVKVFDTTGHGRVAAGSTTSVKVNAIAGVPPTSTGVMVRVIARNATTRGELSLHACGAAVTGISLVLLPANLNATMTVVKTAGGAICATTSAAIDLRIDVVGFVSTAGVGLRPVLVHRALDTRQSKALTAGGTVELAGPALGIGTGEKGVTLTVTLVGAVTAGSFGIGPCNGTPWIVPFVVASAQVFSAMVRTAGANICMSSTQAVHVVVDVNGVWTGLGGVAPSGPRRMFDSRTSAVVTTTSSKMPVALAPGQRRALLSLTLIGTKFSSVLYAWPCSLPRPTASAGSVGAGLSATVVMSYDATHGGLCMASNSSTHVTIDASAVS
jgi:hypothetical protein